MFLEYDLILSGQEYIFYDVGNWYLCLIYHPRMKIPIFKHNTEMVTDGNIYQDCQEDISKNSMEVKLQTCFIK